MIVKDCPVSHYLSWKVQGAIRHSAIVQPVVWKLAQGVITHPGDPT